MATSEELTSTFGVLLIGFIFAVVLYGLTFFRAFAARIQRLSFVDEHAFSETYIYYTRFPQDKTSTKWMVSASVCAAIDST